MATGEKNIGLRRLVSPIGGLIVILVISLAALIFINYYTLRTMSTVRAYIYGESAYSKGEKNATQNLLTYISNGDSAEWNGYLRNISIPLGDRLARERLMSKSQIQEIREGFLQGGNHPEDVDDLIWLFQTFQDSRLFRDPIRNWERGDSLINQKHALALQIKSSVDQGTIEQEKHELLAALKENTIQLTREEENFSASLGNTARQITTYLFIANLIFALIIFGSVSVYIFYLLGRLNKKNEDLANANKELDRLLYTISHDLRSPINSLMGLVGLAQREPKSEQIGVYLNMMNQALKKQEAFVKETIEMSRENRSALVNEIVDLSQLIDHVINMHRHMTQAAGIRFTTDIGIYRAFTDKNKLEIILRNLISNAIKYHDPDKNDRFIKVVTTSQLDKVCIDVIDNGLGIELKNQEKVFNIYYTSTGNEKGSGLGLYIVNEMVNRLGGEIVLKSTTGGGSTFSIVLPK